MWLSALRLAPIIPGEQTANDEITLNTLIAHRTGEAREAEQMMSRSLPIVDN